MSGKIMVVQDGKKWKVLVDYIQRGTLYSTKEQAEKMAKQIVEASC